VLAGEMKAHLVQIDDRKLSCRQKLMTFSSFVNLLTEVENYFRIFLSAILPDYVCCLCGPDEKST